VNLPLRIVRLLGGEQNPNSKPGAFQRSRSLYIDAKGVYHGFIYDTGMFTPIDDPLCTSNTIVNGINNRGQIIGYYYNGSGQAVGFLATPMADAVPEPSIWAMMLLGFVGLGFISHRSRLGSA
jgi:hypothetical protein